MNVTVTVIDYCSPCYLAIGSPLNQEREGEGARPLFTQTKDNLTYTQAEKELDPLRILNPDDYLHFVVSLEPEEFQRLGTTDQERLSEYVEVIRDVMPELAKELKVREINWVGPVHLNTDNPHTHLLAPKEMSDALTGEIRRVERLPADLLPGRKKLLDETERVVGGRISELFVAAIERRARPVKEIQIEDQAEGRVISRVVVEPRTLNGREPTLEEHLIGRWLSSEIQAACFTPDRVEEKTPGRTFKDFVRVRGERERLRREVRKLDAERAARGEDVVPAFISPNELIGSLEGRPKTLALSLRVKKSKDTHSNSGELALEQEEHQRSETIQARVEFEKETEIFSDRTKEKNAGNIISGESREPDESILHHEALNTDSREEHDLLDIGRIEDRAASMERSVAQEAPDHAMRTMELPLRGNEVVKENHTLPAPPTKATAQKEQLPLFKGMQGQLDFEPKLTTPPPSPDLTGVPPSLEREETVEQAHPLETQEHVAPELEDVSHAVEISQHEQAPVVEADHLSDEELSRYAGWARFYSHHLEHERNREEQALQSTLADRDAERRRVSDRELEEMKNRIDLLKVKENEAFLLDECYDQACNKRGIKPEPFSLEQRDYLKGRFNVLDKQSANLAERRIEIVREKLPAIEQLIDPSSLNFYRRAQERSSESKLLQEREKEDHSRDKTKMLNHKTQILGAPERTESSKPVITTA